MNCVCYLSEMGIRTGAIKSLGRTLNSIMLFIKRLKIACAYLTGEGDVYA